MQQQPGEGTQRESGGPLGSPLGDPALAEAERALKRGRRKMLVAMIGAAVAALAALGLYMASGDDEVLARFGRRVNGLDKQHYKAFWACVLPGANLRDIRDNETLVRQIHLRAERRPKAYAKHLRERCLPKLKELEPALGAVIVPAPFDKPLQGMDNPPVRQMEDAVRRLRAATLEFANYLQGLAGGYDREEATQALEPVARAWYDYKLALARLNQALREALGKQG